MVATSLIGKGKDLIHPELIAKLDMHLMCINSTVSLEQEHLEVYAIMVRSANKTTREVRISQAAIDSLRGLTPIGRPYSRVFDRLVEARLIENTGKTFRQQITWRLLRVYDENSYIFTQDISLRDKVWDYAILSPQEVRLTIKDTNVYQVLYDHVDLLDTTSPHFKLWEMSDLLGSTTVINYSDSIARLVKAGLIRVVKDGRHVVCFQLLPTVGKTLDDAPEQGTGLKEGNTLSLSDKVEISNDISEAIPVNPPQLPDVLTDLMNKVSGLEKKVNLRESVLQSQDTVIQTLRQINTLQEKRLTELMEKQTVLEARLNESERLEIVRHNSIAHLSRNVSAQDVIIETINNSMQSTQALQQTLQVNLGNVATVAQNTARVVCEEQGILIKKLEMKLKSHISLHTHKPSFRGNGATDIDKLNKIQGE